MVRTLTFSLSSALPTRYQDWLVSTQGAGAMSDGGHAHPDSFEAKHAAIIARTLRWGDEAAERGDWSEALRWVEKVRSLGQPLSAEYEAKRQVWLQAVDPGAAAPEQAAPYDDRTASG